MRNFIWYFNRIQDLNEITDLQNNDEWLDQVMMAMIKLDVDKAP
jgi:hypothetical protein